MSALEVALRCLVVCRALGLELVDVGQAEGHAGRVGLLALTHQTTQGGQRQHRQRPEARESLGLQYLEEPWASVLCLGRRTAGLEADDLNVGLRGAGAGGQACAVGSSQSFESSSGVVYLPYPLFI